MINDTAFGVFQIYKTKSIFDSKDNVQRKRFVNAFGEVIMG